MEIKANSRILFFGDSVTDAGRSRTSQNDIMQQKPFGDGYVDLVAGMLQGFFPELNLRVINSGISGNTTRDLLNRFESDVEPRKPDIIFIMIGANDAWRHFDSPYSTENHISPDEYAQNILEITKKCKALTSNVFIMSPYLLDTNRNDEMRKMIDGFGQACKQSADSENAVFVDIQAEFDKAMSICHPYVFSWDRVHPDRAAQMIIARQVLHTLGLRLDS